MNPPYDDVHLIADPLFGYLRITVPARDGEVAESTLIDDPWVQRLKRIHQLQSSWWVFPAAEHSRFAHSLGTMHLAGKLARQMYPTLAEVESGTPSLPLVEETLRLAGLLHDLGHGPFSHFCDEEYLQPVFGLDHEQISQYLIVNELGGLIAELRRSPSGRFAAAEAVDVHGAERDAAHGGVAPHVVHIVDRHRAGKRAVQQAHPARDGAGFVAGRARATLLCAHQEGNVPGVDALALAEGSARAAPQFRDEPAELVDDEVLRDLLVIDAEDRLKVLLVAEVAERAVTEVVEQAGQPQGLFDQRQGRRAGLDLGEGGVHLSSELTGQMHRPETVGEAAVLGGREHPPRALQLMDALEALHPGVVDDVGLGDLAGARQRDAQVAVERIGDEMDVVVGESHRAQPGDGA